MLSPQFHEFEDVVCEDAGVDCLSDLDEPATYTKSKNMHLLGFSSRIASPSTSQYNTDFAFWGHTAYQGNFNGFRIIDISNPENPTELINYTDCVSNSTQGAQGDVVIWDKILVRSWDAPRSSTLLCGGQTVPAGFEGLHIFDVSNPLSPQVVASVDLPCGSHTAMGVPDLANDRLLIYSSPSSASCLGLDIVEVPLDDPASASWLRFEPAGTTGTPLRCHDGSVILGSVNLVACAGGTGLTVWSMASSDGGSLEDPAFLYRRSFTGVTIGHSASFTWDGRVIVFGHEPGGGVEPRCQTTSNVVDRTLFFVDARTGTDLGSFVLPRTQSQYENCTWHNYNVVPTDARYVLVSGNYQAGISVVDFTNPAAAQEIAFADPAQLVNQDDETEPVFGGDWAAFWYNGLIYESDSRRGMLVWNLTSNVVAGARKLDHLNPQTLETSSPLGGKKR